MINWIILHSVLVVGRLDATTSFYETHVNGILFEEVHPRSFSDYFFDVTDMELDLFLPGNIIFISYPSLWTINIETREAHELFSVLNSPYSLVQLSSTLVLVTEYGCVRALNRTDNQVLKLIGRCHSLSSYMDGPFDKARFGELFGSVRLTSTAIAVADPDNLCVRKIDLGSEEVSTLIFLNEPIFSLAIQLDKLFFATEKGQIGHYDLITGQHQYIISQSYSEESVDGGLQSAVIQGYGISIKFLTEDILLIAERPNTIRVIDLSLDRVSSLCGGLIEPNIIDGSPQGVATGNISECEVFGPRSFVYLPDENRILVAFLYSIGHIDISGWRCPGYLCKDTECISYDKVCDGFNDCESGDDELDCFTPLSSSTEDITTTTASQPTTSTKPTTSTQPTTASQPTKTNEPITGLGIGVIVGIIVGVAVLLIIITILGCVVFRLYRRNRNLSQNDTKATYTSTKQDKALPSRPDNPADDNTYCSIYSGSYADNSGYMVPIQY